MGTWSFGARSRLLNLNDGARMNSLLLMYWNQVEIDCWPFRANYPRLLHIFMAARILHNQCRRRSSRRRRSRRRRSRSRRRRKKKHARKNVRERERERRIRNATATRWNGKRKTEQHQQKQKKRSRRRRRRRRRRKKVEVDDDAIGVVMPPLFVALAAAMLSCFQVRASARSQFLLLRLRCLLLLLFWLILADATPQQSYRDPPEAQQSLQQRIPQ